MFFKNTENVFHHFPIRSTSTDCKRQQKRGLFSALGRGAGRLAPQAGKIPLRFARRDFRVGLPSLGGIPHSHLLGGGFCAAHPPGLACRLGRSLDAYHRHEATPLPPIVKTSRGAGRLS